MDLVKRFLRDEQGQDLYEFTLLMAFLTLVSVSFLGASVRLGSFSSLP